MDEKIFGYGSLVWKPGFENYSERILGYITNYERRFYQISKYHRGTEHNPGRVVTLLPKEGARTYGVCYTIKEQTEGIFETLNQRECVVETFELLKTLFYPLDGREPYQVKIYIATKFNPNFDIQPEETIADIIYHASGNSGTNIEYLYKLLNFMKKELPHVSDDHLLALDDIIKSKYSLIN